MDKKQNSLEWQFEQLFNSFEKFDNGEYTFDEYLKMNLKIQKQANQMHKCEIANSYDQMRCLGNFENGEQYYNQTFNK
jgi:hypothetical protein